VLLDGVLLGILSKDDGDGNGNENVKKNKRFNNNNNNNNLFIYSAIFNMLGDQKRITTINNPKTIQILEVYKYI